MIHKKDILALYTEINQFLSEIPIIKQILPAGSTKYMLDNPNCKKIYTKDVDLIGIINSSDELLLYVNKIKKHISKYKTIIEVVDNFPNLVSFNFADTSVDLFLTTDELTNIKFVSELRFFTNESNPHIKGSFKNMLIDSIIKSRGYSLDYNSLIRYKYITDIVNINTEHKYITNYYLFLTTEYNKYDYKRKKIKNVYWLDVFENIFGCKFT